MILYKCLILNNYTLTWIWIINHVPLKIYHIHVILFDINFLIYQILSWLINHIIPMIYQYLTILAISIFLIYHYCSNNIYTQIMTIYILCNYNILNIYIYNENICMYIYIYLIQYYKWVRNYPCLIMNLFSCWALGDATRATGRSSAERLRLGSYASAFNNEAWDFLWEHMGKYVERVYSIWIYSMFDGKIYGTGMNIVIKPY
jgi:hypothetical protein